MLNQAQKIFTLLICLLFTCKQEALCQNEELDYDQVTVKLNVDKLGIYEIDAVYYNDNLYFPLIDLFTKLEIYLNYSPQFDTIKGYILSNENTFYLFSNSGKISFKDKEKTLKPEEIVSTSEDVYLPIKIFQEIFGMTMDFNFRELTVFLRSDIELPIIKQLRIKKLRTNLLALTGEIATDTIIQRKWNWARGGVIDWSLFSKIDNLGSNVQQFKNSLGMELLGGELNWRSVITRDSAVRFQSTNIRWRYVNDKFSFLKQIEAGNINVNLTGQTISNFYGIKLTNTPYSIKKSYGSYFIQRKTKPEWDVELYINGILINFTTADMNGDFNFEIPLVFGNSIIMLRYYGPWGQENTEEIAINIPFSFTAHKHFEYQFFSGVTGDSTHNLFNKTKLSYGLSRWATISTGYEYFEGSVFNRNVFTGSINIALGKKTLFNYTYLYNSNHFAEFIFRSKRNLVLNGKHRQYIKNQTLIQTTNKAESELNLNYPIWNKKLKIYFRNTNRAIFSSSGYQLITEAAISFTYKRIHSGLSYIRSSESAVKWNTSIYLKKNWVILQQSIYNFTSHLPVSSTVQVQKRFNKKFFADASFVYNFPTQDVQLGVSIYYNFNAMRSAVTTSARNNYASSSQSLAGSVYFTERPNPIYTTNTNCVGRAGIDVLVFLDINHNDKKDDNEPLVKNASVAINKGNQVLAENDTVHRFVSLEPYAPYLLTIANNGFSNISWILEKSTWSVMTNPNQIKKIYIPIKPMGEIEMTIKMNKNEKIVPANRLIVYIFNDNKVQITKGLTDQDGNFTFLGLSPGNYAIKFDEKQLKGLGLSSNYVPKLFEIKISPQGDYVSGVEIILLK